VLVLGFVAPALGPGPASIVPAGWSKTFDGPLVDDGTWDNGGGCTFNSSGLDVQGGTQGQVCAFTPSTQRDLTSQGFALEVQLAAAANVQGDQRVVIAVGGDSDGARLIVAQTGQFTLCRNASEVCVPNLTDAWHGDSYVANSIALRYLPDTGGGGQLAYFANGQLVTTIGLDLGSSATLGIGAGSDAEALFTHATVYSASA
jgi:hypothetical protein